MINERDDYKFDNQTYPIIIRHLGFLVLNLKLAIDLLENRGIVLKKEEKEQMEEIWEMYVPVIHWHSNGQFYDKKGYEKYKKKICTKCGKVTHFKRNFYNNDECLTCIYLCPSCKNEDMYVDEHERL